MTDAPPRLHVLIRCLLGALVGTAIAFGVPFLFGLIYAGVELVGDVMEGTFRVERLGGAVALAAGISFLFGIMAAPPIALLGGLAGVFWPHDPPTPPES